MDNQPGGQRRSMSWALKLLLLFFVLFILTAGIAVYFFTKYKAVTANPSAAAASETQELVEKVGRLIVLPEGEQPTIATVTDPEALKNQPFFARAKMGDQVLLYTGARKVILYDPVADKIVEVAGLNIGEEAPQINP